MLKLIYPSFWQKRTIISYLLWPLSKIYQLLGLLRRIVRKPIKLPGHVICVGNVTVGGTGKTQVVIWLAKIFAARNIKFVIISKGYGGSLKAPILVNNSHTPEEIGDEALMMSEYGPVISAPQITQTINLLKSLNPEVIIVDDGMQNPGWRKDFTIMTVDGTRWFGNGFLLPAGPLRQDPYEAKADCMILVGGSSNAEFAYHPERREGSNLPTKSKSLQTPYDNYPVFQAQIAPNTDLDKTKTYFAFSGIGNPERFFGTLKQSGFQLTGTKIFPDHHNYSKNDLEYLNKQAQDLNSILITTRKDYIKVRHLLNTKCFDVKLLIEKEEWLIDLVMASCVVL